MTTNIETILNEIKTGKPIILIDDENRENEGDIVIAAEKVTPEIINFMATHARGLVCLAMAEDLVDRLQLPSMTTNNQTSLGTNFTVSIEARNDVTTGISAFDRATTILTAIADNAKPDDIISPGHVFPLRAQKGGVLTRCGHTEGSVDLARLATLKPAAVICEIMDEDGRMARLPYLENFAAKHNLKIATINDLIKYRLRHDKSLIKHISSAKLPTAFGDFVAHVYIDNVNKAEHIALVKGTIKQDQPILTRVHSECLTGDVFHSHRCDCGEQLHTAMQMIAQKGCGIILYLRQEGRGIGLANKIAAYSLQEQGLDTVDANLKLGFAEDLRDYGIGAQILLDLGASKLRLLTNNPKKLIGLAGYGLEIVENVPLEISSRPENAEYMYCKKTKMGHLLNL
jgi:3,4-dihydroxy 2-butanone 4-phosphate synthase/GTP cyclohydrolase II